MVARPGALSNVFEVRATNVSIYGKRRKAKMKKPKKKKGNVDTMPRKTAKGNLSEDEIILRR